jgi:asparagine synthetase B (glutamine-hydrolysing)
MENFEESKIAKIVSKFNNNKLYTKILIEKDLLDLLDEFFEYMDEPFVDD